MKKALITGITGQDGSYLTRLLLSKGYEVHGLRRRSSTFNTQRIDSLIFNEEINNKKLFLHYADMTDSLSISSIINNEEYDEIYNLAAQSHVGVSFQQPEYTANTVGLGAIRILEAIKNSKLSNKTRFYQASTSELYGGAYKDKQSESTPFYPKSPYAISKLFAYWATINYRESYNIFAVNGILFNHESPVRGETFVTRKITRGVTRIFYGLQDYLVLGNLNAKRDWGHAKEFVEMMWLSLQHDKPYDYVAATGKQYSIREFIVLCLKCLGIKIKWQGEGLNETGVIVDLVDSNYGKTRLKLGDVIIRISEEYFRPSEVESLIGDATFAKNTLGWEAKITIDELAEEMIKADALQAKNQLIIRESQ